MAADSDPIGAVPSSLVREDVVSSPRPSPSASLSVAFPPEVSPPALPEVAGANAPSLQKSSHEEVEEQQPSVEGAAEASQELNIEFDEGAGWCGGNDEEWSSLRLGDEAEIPVEEEGGSSGLPGKASQVDMAGGSAEGTKEEEPPAPVEADKELLRSEQSEFVETFLEGVEGSWGGDDDTGWEEDAKVNAVPVKEPELFLKLAPWGGQEDEEGGEAPQLSGEEATETSNVSLCLKNGCLSDPTEGSGGQDVGSSEVDQPNALSQIEEEAPSSGGAGEDKEATAEDDVRLHGRQGVCNASLKSGDDDERVSQDLDRNGEVKLDEPKADERARMGFAPCSVEAIASPNKPGNDDKEEEEDESDSDGQFAWADAGPPEDEDHKQAEKVMVGVEDSDGGVAELLKQVSDAKAAADQHQLEEHHTAALEASTPQVKRAVPQASSAPPCSGHQTNACKGRRAVSGGADTM